MLDQELIVWGNIFKIEVRIRLLASERWLARIMH
jgi:hypothetical protein